LALMTLGYNVVEASVAIAAGAAAGSVALWSFGGDAVVEAMSALVIVWQFTGVSQEREQAALRWIGVAFLALAAFVTVDAGRALLTGSEASVSPWGIALTATSLVAMPTLVVAKRRAGQALNSPTVLADSMQTVLCTLLSAVVLVGLLVNGLLGWGWADPVAALVVAVVAVREGHRALRGHGCAC
jgi:divalent metal cation (Fe/Co/Zn/Cd) transporter